MSRVVIDTNIFFSALVSKNGASFRLIHNLFLDDKIVNLISLPIVIELRDVLLREDNKKLYPQFSNNDIIMFINDICAVSESTKINYLWRPFLKDYGDDKILETAFNGNAKYIITHNIKDFKCVSKRFDICILTPQQFIRGGF